jgi:DNA-binding NtrC family response regulator
VLIAAELKAAGRKEGKHITAIHPAAMEKLLRHSWRGNLRELSHTVRTMTLFCDGNVILPEHVVFPPDLDGDHPVEHKETVPVASNNHRPHDDADLSLAGAVQRHVQFVYHQTKQNQRQTAKLLGISRATLARHLRNTAKK